MRAFGFTPAVMMQGTGTVDAATSSFESMAVFAIRD